MKNKNLKAGKVMVREAMKAKKDSLGRVLLNVPMGDIVDENVSAFIALLSGFARRKGLRIVNFFVSDADLVPAAEQKVYVWFEDPNQIRVRI